MRLVCNGTLCPTNPRAGFPFWSCPSLVVLVVQAARKLRNLEIACPPCAQCKIMDRDSDHLSQCCTCQNHMFNAITWAQATTTQTQAHKSMCKNKQVLASSTGASSTGRSLFNSSSVMERQPPKGPLTLSKCGQVVSCSRKLFNYVPYHSPKSICTQTYPHT